MNGVQLAALSHNHTMKLVSSTPDADFVCLNFLSNKRCFRWSWPVAINTRLQNWYNYRWLAVGGYRILNPKDKRAASEIYRDQLWTALIESLIFVIIPTEFKPTNCFPYFEYTGVHTNEVHSIKHIYLFRKHQIVCANIFRLRTEYLMEFGFICVYSTVGAPETKG